MLVRVPPPTGLAATSNASRSRVRLTRRGRFVLLAAVAALITLALVAARGSGTVVTSAGPAVRGTAAAVPVTTTVTAHHGDTLWSIARAAAPTRDPRRTVEQLRRLNDLDAVDLRPGQRIVVPVDDQRPTRRSFGR